MVTKILINSALSLLDFLVAYFSFSRWRKIKGLWPIIAAVAAILSAFAFWLSRQNGFILLVGAALLFGLGELFKKK